MWIAAAKAETKRFEQERAQAKAAEENRLAYEAQQRRIEAERVAR